jgi:hypothetical protein
MTKYPQVSDRRAKEEARAVCLLLQVDCGKSKTVEKSAREFAVTLAFLLRAHVARERERWGIS